MKVAYGMNRTRKEMDAAGVKAEKYFLDNKVSGMQERLDLVHAVKKGVTVVVLSMADFGKGMAQRKIVKAIEKAGGKIEVMEDGSPAAVGGRPLGVRWPSDEALKDALVIWDALPAKEALAMIEKRHGVKADRNHMNHQRRKRALAKLKQ